MNAKARAKQLARVREECMSFPEVTERLSHGAPSFFVRGKKTIAMFVDDHHGDDIVGIWCAALPGAQRWSHDLAVYTAFVGPPRTGAEHC